MIPNDILVYSSVPCLAVIRESLAADRSRYRDPQPDKEESKLKVSIGSLPREIGEPRRRGGGKTVGVRGDGGHQENTAH